MKLHLQPRDIALLIDLGEYGLLDTVTIQKRHWADAKTPRACQQRLKLLADEGLIKKANLIIALQNNSLKSGGSLPTAFALAPNGASIIEQLGHPRPKRVARSEPKAATLLHRLEVIHTRLAMDDACQSVGLPLPEWIYEQDTRPGAKLTDPIEKRHTLYERFQVDGHEPFCRPDASCLLRLPKSGSENEFAPLIVYYEIDRGSNSPKVEFEKTYGYQALIDCRRYFEHWPEMRQSGPGVRVFYICPTQERIDSIVGALRHREVAKWYRFTTLRQAVTPDIVREEIWQDIAGRRYAIFAKPS